MLSYELLSHQSALPYVTQQCRGFKLPHLGSSFRKVDAFTHSAGIAKIRSADYEEKKKLNKIKIKENT